MSTILLNSKTRLPRASVEVINRERLIGLLRPNVAKKLTIVRAPAGYGKTTLLSQYIDQLDEPVAWFSIDTFDNDPVRFWQYVIQAVFNTIQSDNIGKILKQYDLKNRHSLPDLINVFLNELSEVQKDIHLVLDDYHFIENDLIHEMLSRFIDNLPNNVRIYLTCRTEVPLPVAKWRIKSWLTEIDRTQLCFTLEEIECYFQKKELFYETGEYLQTVLEKTEGWITGIQLAGLSLGKAWHEKTTNVFTRAQPWISEFLLQEILAILPISTQDFLIRTSILSELDPEICNELTNRSDSHSILMEMERNGIFTNRLLSSHPVFRYHQLFADALQIELRERYSKVEIDTIYIEAAMILYKKGNPVSAIKLAIQVQNFQLAEKWITTYITEIFATGQTEMFKQWVQTLLEHQYIVSHELLVMYLIVLGINHEMKEANELIEELERRNFTDGWMDKEENQIIVSLYEKMKAFIVFSSGDNQKIIGIVKKLLKKGYDRSSWDIIPISYNQYEDKILRTSIGARGKLWSMDKAVSFTRLFRETDFKEQSITGFSYGLLAEIFYERNRLDEALIELEDALKYGYKFNDFGLLIPMYLLKCKIYLIKKQFIAAHALLDSVIERTKDSYWVQLLHGMKVQCYLREGDYTLAQQEHDKLMYASWQGVDIGQAYLSLVHARLLLANKKEKEALRYILQVKERAIQEEQISTIIEALVLEAVCQQALADEHTAFVALHQALEQGVMYEYTRTFLDEEEVTPLLNKYLNIRQNNVHLSWNSVPLTYVKQMLKSSMDSNMTNQIEHLLTRREQDVLKMLISGASNSEIAEQLFLTEGTIRTYLTRIYSKLNVQSRTQAVLLVKEWGE